jgi:hypothetical protein
MMANDFDALVAKAHATNKRRDAIDRKAGVASPYGLELVRTAQAAIECAVRLGDWEVAAEAWVFLSDFLTEETRRVRP